MIDPRIPVFFSGRPGSADTAWLVQRGTPPPPASAPYWFSAAIPSHARGCPCCRSQGGVAVVLGELFRSHARENRSLRRVVVLAGASGEAAVRAALMEDPLARSRFRIA